MLATDDTPPAAVAADSNGHKRPMAITVTGLTKRYGDIEAVRGVDFEVAEEAEGLPHGHQIGRAHV